MSKFSLKMLDNKKYNSYTQCKQFEVCVYNNDEFRFKMPSGDTPEDALKNALIYSLEKSEHFQNKYNDLVDRLTKAGLVLAENIEE